MGPICCATRASGSSEPQAGGGGGYRKRVRHQRARKYDQKVLKALKIIWEILDYLCGKRLVAILPEVVPILERHGELKVDANTRERLIQISAATIDRLLEPERRKHRLKGAVGPSPERCSNTRFRSSVRRLARGSPRFFGSGPGGS